MFYYLRTYEYDTYIRFSPSFPQSSYVGTLYIVRVPRFYYLTIVSIWLTYKSCFLSFRWQLIIRLSLSPLSFLNNLEWETRPTTNIQITFSSLSIGPIIIDLINSVLAVTIYFPEQKPCCSWSATLWCSKYSVTWLYITCSYSSNSIGSKDNGF